MLLPRHCVSRTPPLRASGVGRVSNNHRRLQHLRRHGSTGTNAGIPCLQPPRRISEDRQADHVIAIIPANPIRLPTPAADSASWIPGTGKTRLTTNTTAAKFPSSQLRGFHYYGPQQTTPLPTRAPPPVFPFSLSASAPHSPSRCFSTRTLSSPSTANPAAGRHTTPRPEAAPGAPTTSPAAVLPAHSNHHQHNQFRAFSVSHSHQSDLSSTQHQQDHRPQSQPDAKMYTASFAFFEALYEAGVSHVFVNLGSDHPSIIEAMVKGQIEADSKFPRIITCPNEMVAMSMADGYARLTGQPQCVIVHVDVGTQGLGAAVHNASTGRAPILVFAGLSPFTIEGEMRGSRTEYIHWIQDVPDQKHIISQYCRYTAEIKTGKNVKQMVNRALQFATSDPKGPVHLVGAREAMEEDITPYSVNQEEWEPVELGGLTPKQAGSVAEALRNAERPMIITGFSGRNQKVPAALVDLANKVKGLRVLDTGGSDMCFPASHPAWLGLKFGVEPLIKEADVVVILDCDVPWIPVHNKPADSAQIFHIDVDPLKQMMPVFYVPAKRRFRADALTSIEQITAEVDKLGPSPKAEELGQALQASYHARLADIKAKAEPAADGQFGTGHLCRTLRNMCPLDTIWAIEAVTNTGFVHDNIQPETPGSWINCGGGGLGWSGGGALGIKLATDKMHGGPGKGKFVVQIVGDGTFLFSVPGSVYWISRRYNIPVLTIVLNNKGWNAPRRSMLLVHPDGLGSKATNEDLNISFDPMPDFAGIAKAAADGNLFAARVAKTDELQSTLQQAIEAVQGGQSAVVDCKVLSGC